MAVGLQKFPSEIRDAINEGKLDLFSQRKIRNKVLIENEYYNELWSYLLQTYLDKSEHYYLMDGKRVYKYLKISKQKNIKNPKGVKITKR